jgi:hypothetical protein
MNSRSMQFATLFAVLVLALAIAAVPAKADSFDVSLNTSTLSGTQIIAFSLVNGGGGADNTVTLSDFAFGGGSPVPPANYLGTSGVSGDLSGSITMDDSVSLYGGTALFAEDFDPGSTISFLLTTSNNSAGTTPDAFSMSVCDTSFNCYSDDTSTGALLALNLSGGTLTPASFTLNGASAQDLPAPVVTVASSTGGGTTMPEPPSVLLLGLGIVALALCSCALRGPKREVATLD